MWLRLSAFLILLAVLALPGCARRPPARVAETPEVTVSLPLPSTVTEYEDFIGRFDAIDNIEIKARVTGYLTKVNFKDGDFVPEKKLLYEIDPRPYQAELDKANGELEKLRGKKKLIETEVDRYTKLVKKGAASQQDLDVYVGQQAENKGSIAAAESQVRYAELYLKYCKIKAPASGLISRSNIQIGNLVAADKTLLTTLVPLDPIYAYFNVEESTYLRIQTLTKDGIYQDPENVEVKVGLADDAKGSFPYAGKLDFVNNQINPQTGTILLRGKFINKKRRFKPGLFARVRALFGPRHLVLLVADRAISSDQGQRFVYVVDAQNKVVYKRVRVGLTFDGLRAIEEGVEPGDRIIVNGLQRVRPGIEVKTKTESMKKWRAGNPAH